MNNSKKYFSILMCMKYICKKCVLIENKHSLKCDVRIFMCVKDFFREICDIPYINIICNIWIYTYPHKLKFENILYKHIYLYWFLKQFNNALIINI